MHPDRQVVLLRHALEDREELGLVERPAVDVGEDLDALARRARRWRGPSPPATPATLFIGSEATKHGKQVRVLRDDLGHAVVGEARELGGLSGAAEELDRRHRERQHLLVARAALHHLDALVQVPEHRDVHPALELRGERPGCPRRSSSSARSTRSGKMCGKMSSFRLLCSLAGCDPRSLWPAMLAKWQPSLSQRMNQTLLLPCAASCGCSARCSRFMAMAIAVRELLRHMGSFEIVFLRSVGMLAITLALLPRAGLRKHPHVPIPGSPVAQPDPLLRARCCGSTRSARWRSPRCSPSSSPCRCGPRSSPGCSCTRSSPARAW